MVDLLHSRSNLHKHLCGSLVQHTLLELLVRFVFQLLVTRLLKTSGISITFNSNNQLGKLLTCDATSGGKSYSSAQSFGTRSDMALKPMFSMPVPLSIDET